MQAPLFVRSPTELEQQALTAGLRSADAFTLRRCQIVLASARGERVPAIARGLGCGEQTVRNAIHAFDTQPREHSTFTTAGNPPLLPGSTAGITEARAAARCHARCGRRTAPRVPAATALAG